MNATLNYLQSKVVYKIDQLTVVNVGIFLLKVDHRWELFEAVLLHELLVLCLDHPHPDSVGVVINVLQMLESLLTGFTVAGDLK